MTYTQSADAIEQLMSQLFDMSGLAQIPQQGLNADAVLAQLAQRKAHDPDFHSNRLFGLVYQTEHPDLENVVLESNAMYLWGNASTFEISKPHATRVRSRLDGWQSCAFAARRWRHDDDWRHRIDFDVDARRS